MLGAIIGDIVGSPYEFTQNNIKTTDFPLFSARSHFTDDTVMSVAVAEGIMEGYGDPEATRQAVIRHMHQYGRRYPDAGYGGNFALWIYNRKTLPYNSYGNGSAMRVSSVAWAYDSMEEVERYAALSAAVTHNHPEGIKGACATAACIFMARQQADKKEIRDYVTRHYHYDLSRTLDDIRPSYVHVESCQKSVPEAITAFLESTDFEDALRKVVSIGGDSDTLGAICGAIAEAAYAPLPPEIVKKALERLDAPLRSSLEKWQIWLADKPSR